MNESEMKAFCIELMRKTLVGYLTTINEDGIPYTRALYNLRNKEQFPTLTKIFRNHNKDLLVYFSTNTSSSKVKHIRKNPIVAVYFCRAEPKDFRGVMLSGEIEIVTDQKIKEDLWLDWWELYYPKGVTDEDYTILRLLPDFVEIYFKLRKLTLALTRDKTAFNGAQKMPEVLHNYSGSFWKVM
ncbi:MAG: pyridoxamine 5'-phosphate oxidase family protein [Promethearchaeota archaeon]